jgi:hypothetical protein
MQTAAAAHVVRFKQLLHGTPSGAAAEKAECADYASPQVMSRSVQDREAAKWCGDTHTLCVVLRSGLRREVAGSSWSSEPHLKPNNSHQCSAVHRATPKVCRISASTTRHLRCALRLRPARSGSGSAWTTVERLSRGSHQHGDGPAVVLSPPAGDADSAPRSCRPSRSYWAWVGHWRIGASVVLDRRTAGTDRWSQIVGCGPWCVLHVHVWLRGRCLRRSARRYVLRHYIIAGQRLAQRQSVSGDVPLGIEPHGLSRGASVYAALQPCQGSPAARLATTQTERPRSPPTCQPAKAV